MSPRAARFARVVLLLVLLAALGTSCAYYNTYYLAKKYYAKATGGEPYPVDPVVGSAQPDYGHAIDYSKKVLSNYPKSKWVPAAYLLWARALLGQTDPLETVRLLEDFPTRFPKSSLKNEARFYLGVAYRQARKYGQAVRTLDEYLEHSPKSDLAPYAYLERARALMSMDLPAEAAKSASKVIERFPKSKLADRARVARADAHFEAREFDAARADYRELGLRAANDDDRLKYLLREVDCLEASHQYDVGRTLLRNALAHEQEPSAPDTTGGRPATVVQSPGYDRYGRLMVRLGTIEVHAGHLNESLDAYRRIVHDYPHDALAGEAQFRIGYAYETLADDFDRARTEYTAVKDQVGQTGFGDQAQDRLKNLDRIAQFKSAAGDTTARQVETAFLVAEQYLFELDKPDRALEAYQKIAARFPGTAAAAKALDAQAWVLSRKMNRKEAADSLFWKVVHEYPATEAQLAARDYLEMEGKQVPTELIKLPPPPVVAAIDTASLAAPPDSMPRLGTRLPGVPDSLGRLLGRRPSLGSTSRPPVPGDRGPGFSNDTPSTPRSGAAPPPAAGPGGGGTSLPGGSRTGGTTPPTPPTPPGPPPGASAPSDTLHRAPPPYVPAPHDTAGQRR